MLGHIKLSDLQQSIQVLLSHLVEGLRSKVHESIEVLLVGLVLDQGSPVSELKSFDVRNQGEDSIDLKTFWDAFVLLDDL